MSLAILAVASGSPLLTRHVEKGGTERDHAALTSHLIGGKRS